MLKSESVSSLSTQYVFPEWQAGLCVPEPGARWRGEVFVQGIGIVSAEQAALVHWAG